MVTAPFTLTHLSPVSYRLMIKLPSQQVWRMRIPHSVTNKSLCIRCSFWCVINIINIQHPSIWVLPSLIPRGATWLFQGHLGEVTFFCDMRIPTVGSIWHYRYESWICCICWLKMTPNDFNSDCWNRDREAFFASWGLWLLIFFPLKTIICCYF